MIVAPEVDPARVLAELAAADLNLAAARASGNNQAITAFREACFPALRHSLSSR